MASQPDTQQVPMPLANGSVGSLSSANGQDTLSVFHSLDILRGSFKADKDYFFTFLALFGGFFGSEYDLTGSSARGSGYTFAYRHSLGKSVSVELRVQQHIQRLGVDLHESIFFGDHNFVDQVAGDLDS